MRSKDVHNLLCSSKRSIAVGNFSDIMSFSDFSNAAKRKFGGKQLGQ